MPTASPRTLSDPYEITPVPGPLNLVVRVPGSKSITNRALPLAALAQTPFTLHGALTSDDTTVMIACLRQLGFKIHEQHAGQTLTLERASHTKLIPASRADLFVGNSGTTVRFLSAILGLGEGEYRLDGVPRMRERPIQDLLDALKQIGIDATSEQKTGCPPVVIRSNGWPGGHMQVKANLSSQYLSGLLMAAPFGSASTTIDLVGPLVSEPYVTMTVEMLRAFGLSIDTSVERRFTIPGQQRIKISEYTIEPDASSASYFLAAAAILGGQVTVAGLRFDSLQGDVHFAHILERMGCEVRETEQGLQIVGTGKLRGIDVDMNAISDTVMTLAVVACFADGPTTIRNVAHIRHKETDRLAALATELKRTGTAVTEFEDGIIIDPKPMHGVCFHTYDDHRMAMSLALLGLRLPGVSIHDPGCTAKTYPNFWDDWKQISN